MSIPFNAYHKFSYRVSFGNVDDSAIPDLIKIQKESYDSLLQLGIEPNNRQDKGLESVLKAFFPISDYEKNATIEYVSYHLDEPKYTVSECLQRSVNYSSVLRVKLRLIIWEEDENTGNKEVGSIKEQDVYFGDIPIMTEWGTFVINGTERVLVSQMHRSPGVFYDHDKGKTHNSGKFLYFARIIPYRGSWLDFEFDPKDILYFRIDRKRKIYITTLLRALGFSKDEIFKEFYNTLIYKKVGDKWVGSFDPSKFKGLKASHDIINHDDGEVLISEGTRVTPRVVKKLEKYAGCNYIVDPEVIIGSFIAKDIFDENEGELIAESGDEISAEIFEQINKLGLSELEVLDIDFVNVGPYIRNTLVLDRNSSREESLLEIHKILRPGELSTLSVAENVFESSFFDPDRYDLSAIGRMKINSRHNLDLPETHTTLTKEDILVVIKHLIHMKDHNSDGDDIDNLGNRRIRSAGELVENQLRLCMLRMTKAAVERLMTIGVDSVMPNDLMNSKILIAGLRDLFGTSPLSQFMDQTNPLAEITHKRRISALGPGGLTRDRAGFEVRDVHKTHYGRLCPIETPEGQNIGLISSLATHAQVNKYGFIETPYKRVENGQVREEIDYISAIEESRYYIAPAHTSVDKDGKIIGDIIACRLDGDHVMAPVEKVEYIGISSMQLVSVAASLIPFLENDDANRALMGSNMQRQGVPLLAKDAVRKTPFVGTGMEEIVARDSGAVIIAKRAGIVKGVDSTRIVVKSDTIGEDDEHGVDIYTLTKFQKSNHSTCINQVPLVHVGDKVKKGDILADGSSTYKGELSLGCNALVAFMPWNGYNFEDSILISERIVQDDVFTSVHIKDFEVVARDTRLGPEEITRDIPNVSEESLKHLDEVGIVCIGSHVKPGDILVGKVTPKSESPITPEEKLLRAIFGEKAADVRDSSLHVPSGIEGTVIGVKIFTRRGVEKDARAIAIEREEIEAMSKDRDSKVAIITEDVCARIKELIKGKSLAKKVGEFKVGAKITDNVLNNISNNEVLNIQTDNPHLNEEVKSLQEKLTNTVKDLDNYYSSMITKLQSGDNIQQGALKVVKIYVASKLKIQPGDKMAGRHGNKGVVSKIVPVEDMPFLEDGTPIDIVLSPLGVPSRMNIGQILETHLGWASVNLGKRISEAYERYLKTQQTEEVRELLSKIYSKNMRKGLKAANVDKLPESDVVELAKNLKDGVPFATPVFNGAKESDIKELLEIAKVDTSGQSVLYDGKTGEKFERKVTVGYLYMLKLDHLVNDKIHARSVGPYSLVTQQPLGGKSHFGGQRFGEMECWALQAYGAAYTLKEMLTYKSDDVIGRVKVYESIIRGVYYYESGLPESFNVLVKELMSLGLSVELKSEVNE